MPQKKIKDEKVKTRKKGKTRWSRKVKVLKKKTTENA